jgi:hypothetical protein
MCSRRAGDPPVLVSDSTKARLKVGWTPSFRRLDQQIDHAWKWFRDEMPKMNSETNRIAVDLLEEQDHPLVDEVTPPERSR